MDTQNQQLDPSIVALTKAIGHQESGGDYNKTGDNGHSMGAYQWNNPTPLAKGQVPKNFGLYASEVGADPNDFSPENQDRVAYKTVEKWGKSGLNPAQIASKWNSGSPDNYKTAKPGYNAEQGVNYDVGAYVNNVEKYYEHYNQTSNPQQDGYATTAAPLPKNETPNTNVPQETSLGSQLQSRVGDASNAVSDTMAGKINPISGVLQTVGAGAGAIGDIVNKGLELIPGVKQLEGLLGQGIGALAKTDAGKAVVKSIGDFTKEHPELANDIGAGFNIVTAIPILKGLGAIGKLGMEAGSQALKGIAEKSFISGAPDLIASTKAGARFLESKPSVLKDMLDRRLVGDIKGGEYVTKEAISSSERGVKALNNRVKTILDQPQYAQVGQDGNSIAQKAISGYTNRFGQTIEGMPNSGMTPSELIANAKNLDKGNKLLWDKFEAGQANWQEINKLRSALDGKVKKAFIQGVSLDAPEIALSKEFGANLSSAMRDTLQSTIPETQQFFKEMATQFDIQKALSYMDGKKVVPGGLAKTVGHTIGAGTGGTIGGMIGGTPGAMVGGMIGDRTAGTIANKLAGRNVVQGVLKRTGQNAQRLSKKELASKMAGLFGGAVTQKASK